MFKVAAVESGKYVFNLATEGLRGSIGAYCLGNNPKAAALAVLTGEVVNKCIFLTGRACKVDPVIVGFVAFVGAIYCGYKAGQKVDGNYTVSSHFGNIVIGGLASDTIASIFNLKEIGAK